MAAGNAVTAPAEVLEAAGLDAATAGERAARPVPLAADRLRIDIAGVPVFAGVPLAFDEADASERMRGDEVLIRLDLGLGDGRGEAFGCDLTEQYVIENSEYST
jgi:glutamate N-acetyltransferase/amino-acid N-acetyltransferase